MEIYKGVKHYRHPEISLIAFTQVNVIGFPLKYGNWLHRKGFDGLQNGEILCEFAGRLCYLSFGDDVDLGAHKTVAGRSSSEEYMENILKTGHGSVLEHCNVTFLLEGVSRTLTHEFVRHRHFSYSQLSQRYVDESDVAFVLPPEIKEHREFEIWLLACQDSQAHYKRLLQELSLRGLTPKEMRGTARSVLGACAETKIVVTGNVRAWRHFVKLRANKTADKEIRVVAGLIALKLKDLLPSMFCDFEAVADEIKMLYREV
jgi:thymidylate synthase (FAD)